jgi:beta-lactamase superfamily II metal-dependent hydrolase
MFNLHIVQARYGDCLILEYATAEAPRFILIDGGPQQVYEENLRPVLQGIADKGGSLDYAVLSHVDDDHVVGLLDLLEEIRQQRDSGTPETIAVGEIWHNTFSQTLGGDVEARFNTFVRKAPPMRGAMNDTDRAMRDIAKGDELTHAANALGIPINEEFDPSYLVSLGPANEPVKRENLSIWIVAPNQTNLQNLKQEWLEWLEEQEDRVLVRGMGEVERADTRVPNLSSIMFLARADGKSVLLTGDGRADHLLDGLQQAGLLDSAGKLHVDVLKLPHHGSRHNISKEFLQAVTADQYIVSASGRYSHPSRQTLEWIAEVAREQGRAVEIILTNHTTSVDQLLAGYDPDTYGFSLTEMPQGEQVMVLELGDAAQSGEEVMAPESGGAEEAGEQVMMSEPGDTEERSTQAERMNMNGTLGQWIAEVLAKIKAFFTGNGGDMDTQPKWTFMVYLAGDNNLSDAGETDLQEMAAVGSTAEVNIVAEFDRIGDDAHSKRYYVKKGELQELVDLGETDCGDPNVLLDYIAWTKENYPAERYALVLWNHGGGWDKSSIDTISQEVGTRNFGRAEGAERSSTSMGRAFFRTTLQTIMRLGTSDERAICSDDGSGHSLDTVELGKVLAEAKKLLGQKIDLMGMDACLMANLEVAYQAREYVNYIVASEENEPFDGWPYTKVLQKLVDEPDMATADFGAHIVDAYNQSYAHTNFTVTQAAVDLAKAEELAGTLDELADALIAHMPTAQLEIWSATKKPAAKFWYNTLWDLTHFCERLEAGTADDDVKAAAKKVLKALEPGNFVVAEAHRGEKVERCGGVTVYLKGPPSELSRYYGELDFAVNHRWHELLEAYHE